MDLRNGRTYSTKDEALSAGVPESDIAEVRERPGEEPLVRVTKGPFKNRVYRRTRHGLVRVDSKR